MHEIKLKKYINATFLISANVHPHANHKRNKNRIDIRLKLQKRRHFNLIHVLKIKKKRFQTKQYLQMEIDIIHHSNERTNKTRTSVIIYERINDIGKRAKAGIPV